MNGSELLKTTYNEALKNNKSINFKDEIKNNLKIIAEGCFSQKGVYTVFITLCVYKILNPKQDIRYHQTAFENGFSGRSFDTKHITPTLMELGLPAMKESGWLTRSLEQPYPYKMDYQGKISNLKIKKAFLESIDFIEKNPKETKNVLIYLLQNVIKLNSKNAIKINKLKNPENLSINKIVETLNCQFSYNYKTHGGSKLPVIAFHSIFQIIIREMKRYNGAVLAKLDSHTASDRTSKKVGDIEIFKNDELIEAIEIKLGKEIDRFMWDIAKEKIITYNPLRYCLFSSANIKEDDYDYINSEVLKVKQEHGCQVIINGIIPTLKYYLRLVSDLKEFIKIYSSSIEKDKELKLIHKTKWNEYLTELDAKT